MERRNDKGNYRQIWVMGFLSGVGSMKATTSLDPLKGMDQEGVSAWVDNYCHKHPLDTIATAGSAFVNAHPR